MWERPGIAGIPPSTHNQRFWQARTDRPAEAVVGRNFFSLSLLYSLTKPFLRMMLAYGAASLVATTA